jgi:hypothetical protein
MSRAWQCHYCDQGYHFKVGAKKDSEEIYRYACSDICCKRAWEDFRKLGYTYIFQRKDHPAGLSPSSNAFTRKLTKAFSEAAEEAVQEHHAAGHPVYGMVDGEIVEIPPDEDS